MNNKVLKVKTPIDEPKLVARASAEPAAFAELFDHYFPLVHKYGLFRIHDVQTADDLVSQIFEHMLLDLKKYHPDQAPFGAWLFGIARHVVSDHFKSIKRRRWFSLEGFHDLHSAEPLPEEAALQSDLSDHLLTALETLSDRERDLIGLKFAAGLNNRQIAALSHLGESNVGIILYRAVKHLRTELHNEEINHE